MNQNPPYQYKISKPCLLQDFNIGYYMERSGGEKICGIGQRGDVDLLERLKSTVQGFRHHGHNVCAAMLVKIALDDTSLVY